MTKVLMLSVALALGVPGATSAVAQACTKSWPADTGSWNTASEWIPPGVPGPNDDVCITADGSYTVTVPVLEGGATAHSLTLGAADDQGQQTLAIVSTSTPVGLGTPAVASLAATAGGTIGSSGQIVLDVTDVGVPSLLEAHAGGPATLSGGPFTNNGVVIAKSESRDGFRDELRAPFTNALGGVVEVSTGFLHLGGGLTFTNDGTVRVDGTGYFLIDSELPLAGPRTTLTNTGTVQTNGNLELDNAAWTQAGGSVSGPPVRLQASALEYRSGVGDFDMLEGYTAPGSLAGTIPAGQTVTAVGGSFGAPADSDPRAWTLRLVGDQVVVRGTLAISSMDDQLPYVGGPSIVQGAPIVNYGTVVATSRPGGGPSIYPDYLRSDLTNHGLLDVRSTLYQDNGTITENEGLAALSGRGRYVLVQRTGAAASSTFTNTPGSVLSFAVARAPVPTFAVSSGGTLNAGGTLLPAPVGTFTPRQGQALRLLLVQGGTIAGAFSAVGPGFSADTSHATYVAAVYGTRRGPVRGGRGQLTVQLSCPGGGACPRSTIAATAVERIRVSTGHGSHRKTHIRPRTVVVAAGGGTIAAARTRTFTLKLNAIGRRLLSRSSGRLLVHVAIRTAGAMLGTATIGVLRL